MKPKSTSSIPSLISVLFSSTAAILLVTGYSLHAADITWDDQAGDDLWSSVTNFTTDVTPSGNNITFGTTGSSTTAGTVTSIVDADLTIGTLTFNNSPATSTHTLQINDGVTLTSTPGGVLNTLVIGGTTTNAAVVTSAIRGQTAGQGTLTLDNATGDMIVGFSNTGTGAGNLSTAILDMSALGSFSANLDELRVATSPGANGNAISQLTLANSNSITANTIQIGGSSQSGTTGSYMRLGASNTLNADLIVVGDSRVSATMEFRSGLTTPTVTILGKGGVGTRADLIIADQASTRGLASGGGGSSEITGVVNFQGGTVTASLDELVVGWGGASSADDGSGDGTLSFNAGTIDALTVHIGRMANDSESNANTDNSVSDGILNVSGSGILLANSILLGLNDDGLGGNRQSTTGTLNVSGSATVTTTGHITLTQRTSDSSRAGAGTLNITGGTVTVGGNLIEGSTFAGAGANTSTVTLNGGTLDMMTDGIISVDTFNAQSGTLQNVAQLTNAAGAAAALTKTTSGTLVLAGTNTYTGATTLSAGTLELNYTTQDDSKLADAAALNLGGGTLNLVGGTHPEVVSGTTLVAGGSTTVARPSGASTLRLNALTVNNGSTLNFGADSIADTDNTNTNGILGGYASFGTTDWAQNSTNAGDGAVTAYTTYKLYNQPSTWSTGVLTTDNVTNDGAWDSTPMTTAKVINSLRYDFSGSGTINADANLTISSGGLMVTSNVTSDSFLNGSAGLTSGGTNLYVTQNSASEFSIGAAIFGTNVNLVKSGTGKLNLTNANNSYTGQTYINGGTVQISANENLGAQATGAALNLNGSTLQISANVGLYNVNPGTNNRAVNLGGGGGTFDTMGNTLTIAGAVGNLGTRGALTKTGVGTLILAGANTYTGTTTIGQGTLQVGSGGATGTLSTSSGIVNNGNLTINRTGNESIASAITGTGKIVKQGAGTLILSGVNTYNGNTEIDAGTIRVDANPGNATSNYFVGNGTTTSTAGSLLLGGAGGIGGGITLSNAIQANPGSTGNRVIGGNNTAGTNTFGGTVTLTDSNATFQAATGGIVAFNTLTAASLQTVSVGASGNTGTVQMGGTADNTNIAATVNFGRLDLNKTSSSSVHALGSLLTVNSGATARITGTGGDQIFDSANATVNTGGVLDLNGQTETLNVLTLNGTGISSGGALINNNGSTTSTLTASNGIVLGASSSIGGSANIATSSAIGGSGMGLTKVGAGTVTLGGANTYTGATTVTAGTLSISTNGTLADTSTITIESTAFLNLNFSGSDSVSEFKIGAVTQANGKWGRTGSIAALGADFETPRIIGNGLLNVGSAVSTPYSQWAVDKGLIGGPGSATDPAPTADPDKDGATNLAEFAFNGNPTSGANNGQIYVLTADTDADLAKELVLTIAVRTTTPPFVQGAPATATSATDALSYSIEGSTTLADFPVLVTPVAVVDPGVALTDEVNYVYRSFRLVGSNGLPGKGFLRAKVTTP